MAMFTPSLLQTTPEPVSTSEYDQWQADPSPENLHATVKSLEPTINKAVSAYVPTVTPVLKDRARLLAAKAVRSFDATRGADLKTHVYRQLQALQRMAPKIQDPLPRPERLRRDSYAMTNAIDHLTNVIGREPSDEEVADHMKIPVKHVLKLRTRMRSTIPFSTSESEDEDDETSPDIVKSTMTPEDEWRDAVYHDLGDIDRVIFQHRTGYRSHPVLSNMEIAKRLNLSPAAISQRSSRIQKQLDSLYDPAG